MDFKRGEFQPFKATTTVHLGPIGQDINEGDVLETDGTKARFNGQEFSFPQVKGAIKRDWFVPEDDTSGRRYVSQPAGVQMHSAVPDRNGQRRSISLNTVAQEDHHVVGSVVGSNLGAQSKRTRQAALEQANVPDISGLGHHSPLPQSDPRHATQRVHSSQITRQDLYDARVGEVEVAHLGPTQKPHEGRKKVTPGNSHMMASSVMNAAERRTVARQLESRRRMEEARAQNPDAFPQPVDYTQGERMQGQHVGINSLGQAGGPRNPGGQFNLNDQGAQVVRTIHQPDGSQVTVPQAPAPQPTPAPLEAGAPAGVPSPELWAEFQQFMAFKAMQEAQSAQVRSDQNETMRKAQVASEPPAPPQEAPAIISPSAPPTVTPQILDAQGNAIPAEPAPLEEGEDWDVDFPEEAPEVPYSAENWREDTQDIKSWHKRYQAAIEYYGNDGRALHQIMAVETPGVVTRIREHLGMDPLEPEGDLPEDA